jgi:hypothetical protein
MSEETTMPELDEITEEQPAGCACAIDAPASADAKPC